MTLPDGLYDLLLTERLLASLDTDHADLAAFGGERVELLLDALTRQLSNALAGADDQVSAKALNQVEIVNSLLVLMRQRLQALRPETTDAVDLIATPPQVLRSIKSDRQVPEAPSWAWQHPGSSRRARGRPRCCRRFARSSHPQTRWTSW